MTAEGANRPPLPSEIKYAPVISLVPFLFYVTQSYDQQQQTFGKKEKIT